MTTLFYITNGRDMAFRSKRGRCCRIEFSERPFPYGKRGYQLDPIDPNKLEETPWLLWNMDPTNLDDRLFNDICYDPASRIHTACFQIIEEREHERKWEFIAELCNKKGSKKNPHRHSNWGPEYPPGTQFSGYVLTKNGWGILKVELPEQ